MLHLPFRFRRGRRDANIALVHPVRKGADMVRCRYAMVCLAAAVALKISARGRAAETSQPQGEATVEAMSADEVIARRDKLMAEAERRIRKGLLELAADFPQLAEAANRQAETRDRRADEGIAVTLFHPHLGKGRDSDRFVPEEERCTLVVVVRPAPPKPTAMAMFPLYPHLDLVGQVQACAGDDELRAALEKLVSKALHPLEKLNRRAAAETPSGEPYSTGGEPPISITPLHVAATRGEYDKVRQLLDSGARINALDIVGRTPLHKAALEGHLKIAQLLVERGATVDARDFSGWSPAAAAAYNGHVAMVEFLIDAGAPTTDRNAFDKAAMGGHVEVVKMMLSKGFPLAGPKGAMPLQPAAYGGHADMLKFFLARGADVNIADGSGRTALHYAAQCDHADAAALLIANGADVNAVSENGETPLDTARRFRSKEVETVLLEHGAKGAAVVARRETPLHVAAGGGHLAATKTLVTAGADVNAPDEQGRTPLHRAAAGGHLQTVRFLIESGADAAITDDTGRTPAEHAREGGHEQTAAVIEEAAQKGAGPGDLR